MDMIVGGSGWQSQSILLDTALDRPATFGSICMEPICLILIPSIPRERLPPGQGQILRTMLVSGLFNNTISPFTTCSNDRRP
jgi:hypothetical protein